MKEIPKVIEKEVFGSRWLFLLVLKLIRKMALVNARLRVPFSFRLFFKVSDSPLPTLQGPILSLPIKNGAVSLKNDTFLVLGTTLVSGVVVLDYASSLSFHIFPVSVKKQY